VPDAGGWGAQHVLYTGQHSEWGANTRNLTTFQFYVGSLDIHGPSHAAPIAATRFIYAGGEWNHTSAFHDRMLVVRALSENALKMQDEILSVTIEGEADAIDADALWLWGSFISGNHMAALATEYYAADGSLISRVHRRGYLGSGRRQYFRRFYTPFSAEGMQRMLEGLARLLRENFPVDVALDHLLQAVTGKIDIDAIHLALSYHTAIEAWNRACGLENWIDDNIWEKIAKHIRKDLVSEELYDCIGDEMKENLKAILPHANRTTTAWRQSNLFESLGIDVSGSDAKRVLKMRDELLHNGYLVKRWSALSAQEAQERHDAVERLRKLALLVVFRLTGYEGTYLDPVSFIEQNIAPQADGPVAL
jgi:hypothetical protein